MGRGRGRHLNLVDDFTCKLATNLLLDFSEARLVRVVVKDEHELFDVLLRVVIDTVAVLLW